MARRRTTRVAGRRPQSARGRSGRGRPSYRSQGRSDSRWHGRLLLTVVILLIIWAHWKGQA